MTEGTHPEKQTEIAYGCAFILLVLVIFICATAIILREKQRRKSEQ
jgi:phosphate transport system permease protein